MVATPEKVARPRRGRRRTVVAWVAALVVVGLVIWSVTYTLPVWSVTPGVAQAVTGPTGVLRVPTHLAHPSKGEIFLTDVELTPLTPLGWLTSHFDSHVSYLSSADVLGTVPATQFDSIEALQMDLSQQYATVAALRLLGYSVPERSGPIIGEVLPGSPAARAASAGSLRIGDVIVSVDGHPTPTIAALRRWVDVVPAGEVAHLVLDPADGGARRVVGLTPERTSAGSHELGVGVVEGAYFSLPFPVSVDLPGVGGPSAGLAFSLGTVDELTNGDLTGGLRIGATGEISPDGAVSQVGGVEQKAVAVRRAGATVFLVPVGEAAQARAGGGPHLRVVPVSSLRQALSVLASLGGDTAGLPPGVR